MDRLFDNDPDETIAAMVESPMLASGAQISALVSYGFRELAVQRWPKEKAELVLKKCKKEERAVLNRAAGAARLIDDKDGVSKRSQVSLLERRIAADELERVGKLGPDETLGAIMYTLYVCSDDELRRLAGYLGRLWTAPPPEPEPPPQEGGYADDDPGTDPDRTAGAEAAGGDDAGREAEFGFVYDPGVQV